MSSPVAPRPPEPDDAARASHARRTPRADAQRNRELLVAAAGRLFSAADGTVSLEQVATEAGVGIGTLYRNFPTREALVEAVYTTELDAVTACADELLEQLPPAEALRAWMGRYADFFATKTGMLSTLRSGWAVGTIATPETRSRITAVIATFLAAGEVSGELRPGVDADDVTRLLLGSLMTTTGEGHPERAERLLDIALAGLRVGAERADC